MDKISGAPLAEAHRIRNLYRQAFGNPSKDIARGRVIAAMKAAGVTVVLDLWGGGISASALVAAGFRVISVENGSMKIVDQGRPVSADRKRHAHQVAGWEGGYETFWGTVAEAIAAFPEIDGAYLDFCGPWSSSARDAVSACRMMKCIAVTLIPGHDVSTGALDATEREMAYQLYLKMAWADSPRWAAILGQGHCRRLLDYRVPGGQIVFLYLLGHRHIKLPALTFAERAQTKPIARHRRNARIRLNYAELPIEERRRVSGSLKRGRKGPFTQLCGTCGTLFLTQRPASVCPGCQRAHKSELQRQRRLAAVSGTTAEAIND